MRYDLHLTQANLLKINGLRQLTRLPGSDHNEPASRREKSPALLLQTASRHMGSLVTDRCRHLGPSSLVGAIEKPGPRMCWSASLELKGYVDCQFNPCGENDPGRRCMEILDPQGKAQNPEEEKLLSGYQKD